jgi:hypothetical protein
MRINLDNIDSFVQTHWTGEFAYDTADGFDVIGTEHVQWEAVYLMVEYWEAEEHEDESYTVYRRPGSK